MDPTHTQMPDSGLWAAEGLISFEQAETIRGGGEPWPISRIVEALLYVGAAAFLIAVYLWSIDLMVGDFYQRPDPWGPAWVLTAGAAILLTLGFTIRDGKGGIGRAAGAVLAAGAVVGGAAIQQLFAAIEFPVQPVLFASLLSLVVAGTAWQMRKSVPTEIALFLAAASVTGSVIDLIRDGSPYYTYGAGFFSTTITNTLSGLLIWAVGATWMLLGYRRVLRSANTAYLLGGATVIGASAGLTLGINRWWVLLLTATAGLILAAGIRLRRTILMVPGAAGILALPVIVVTMWAREMPETRTWVMIYGIPGLLLLGAALLLANSGTNLHRPMPTFAVPVSQTPGSTDEEGGPADGLGNGEDDA